MQFCKYINILQKIISAIIKGNSTLCRVVVTLHPILSMCDYLLGQSGIDFEISGTLSFV